MLCEAAPLSLQLVKTYCVPAAPACVVITAMVWDTCVRFSVCGAVIAVPPSMVNCNPSGLVWMVMAVGVAKLAVTVCGALMVTMVEALLALVTVPVQPVKE